MAERHSRIAPEQERGERASHDKRASDDRDLGSIKRGTIVVKHRDDRSCRAGSKAHSAAGEDAVERAFRDAIHILCRIERGCRCLLVERLRKRAEHEAAMDRAILIDAADCRFDLILRDILRQCKELRLDTCLGTALLSGMLVGDIVRALPHTHEGKAGFNARAFQLLGPCCLLLGERTGNRCPSQLLCHLIPLSTLR